MYFKQRSHTNTFLQNENKYWHVSLHINSNPDHLMTDSVRILHRSSFETLHDPTPVKLSARTDLLSKLLYPKSKLHSTRPVKLSLPVQPLGCD